MGQFREMLMPKKNRVAIYEHLFKEGVMVAEKDFHAPKHPELEAIPNLQVIKALTSLTSSALCRVETPGLLVLLLPGPVVISQRETGLHTGRRLEVRTRPVLLALDLRPWSSVEDLDVASPPSSSSVTYERNVIGCSAISRPYVALQAISHWFSVSYCR